ncbi:hypothetical protein BDK51DRAFT_33421 [Blyttiomyces helicus]|uniref:Uncharacterized protein n=1 Tax=Blyttiomyces helicus TaxID=388810 RepID=A0A4P9WGP4_9FUNG|nr:hypothetical protein BDK51DRAFT_33421 [Blyttiomyces helicus]|eukprot:RKO91003.1 hypothetical protein BDK51DRAFT_33421 [Blyttiomyces helicus]
MGMGSRQRATAAESKAIKRQLGEPIKIATAKRKSSGDTGRGKVCREAQPALSDLQMIVIGGESRGQSSRPMDNSLWTCAPSLKTSAAPPGTVPLTRDPSDRSVVVAVPPDTVTNLAPPAVPTVRSSLHEALRYYATSFAFSMLMAALMTALIWASSRVEWHSQDTRAPHLFDQRKFTILCAATAIFCLQTYTALLSICVRGVVRGNITLWTSIAWSFLVMLSYALILEHGMSRPEREVRGRRFAGVGRAFEDWFYYIDSAIIIVSHIVGSFLAGWEGVGIDAPTNGRRNPARAKHALDFMVSEMVITICAIAYGSSLIPIYVSLSVGFTLPVPSWWKLVVVFQDTLFVDDIFQLFLHPAFCHTDDKQVLMEAVPASTLVGKILARKQKITVPDTLLMAHSQVHAVIYQTQMVASLGSLVEVFYSVLAIHMSRMVWRSVMYHDSVLRVYTRHLLRKGAEEEEVKENMVKAKVRSKCPMSSRFAGPETQQGPPIANLTLPCHGLFRFTCGLNAQKYEIIMENTSIIIALMMWVFFYPMRDIFALSPMVDIMKAGPLASSIAIQLGVASLFDVATRILNQYHGSRLPFQEVWKGLVQYRWRVVTIVGGLPLERGVIAMLEGGWGMLAQIYMIARFSSWVNWLAIRWGGEGEQREVPWRELLGESPVTHQENVAKMPQRMTNERLDALSPPLSSRNLPPSLAFAAP